MHSFPHVISALICDQLITGLYNPHKNSQAVKKGVAFKSLDEKSCEIKGGGQQMAAMMLIVINFNNGCALLKFISINIIAAI